MSAAWLVVPTYNEAANIEALVRSALPRLEEAASAGGSPRETRLLIVDDSSPDGTGRVADALAGRLERLEVLHRPAKEGLGRAYLAGFERALAGGAELILQMDADCSHDPADLPRLVAATDGAHLVLGSRYARGGGITDWGLFRRLLSRGGSIYARRVLGVEVRDLTGGFKCFRREALEALSLDSVTTNGYAFQIELTYRAVRAGLHVREVPIVFRERRAGRSKMTPRIALEAVWKVPALRRRVAASPR